MPGASANARRRASATLPLTRHLSIEDLAGIVRPSGVTAAALGRRSSSTIAQLRAGLTLESHCAASVCMDTLKFGPRTLWSTTVQPTLLEEIRNEHGWFEGVVRTSWQDASFVSVYVAQSEYSGGAHAKNHLSCRTIRLATGKPVSLRELMPADQADRWLTNVRAL